MLAVLASSERAGPVCGAARTPSRMLKNARVFGARADLTCKLRVKMHVGRLGVKWAASLVRPPWADLENIYFAGRKVSQKIGSGGHNRYLPL